MAAAEATFGRSGTHATVTSTDDTCSLQTVIASLPTMTWSCYVSARSLSRGSSTSMRISAAIPRVPHPSQRSFPEGAAAQEPHRTVHLARMLHRPTCLAARNPRTRHQLTPTSPTLDIADPLKKVNLDSKRARDPSAGTKGSTARRLNHGSRCVRGHAVQGCSGGSGGP